MSYDLAAAIVISLAALALLFRRRDRYGESAFRLLVAALAIRLLGAFVRYEVIFTYYGVGDALRYYEEGLLAARGIRDLTLNPFGIEYWLMGTARQGTQFVIQFSGVILSVIGSTIRGEFVVFSLLAFLGTYAVVHSFGSLHGRDHTLFYGWLVMLWPSVWFWSSSVGKEALITLAVGLVTLGYVGRGGHVRWIPLLAGTGFAFMIRPHVGFVLAFSAAGAEWLAAGRTWTATTIVSF